MRLALIAAALLTDQPVRLSNVPDTLSTASMLDAAQALGVRVTRQGGDVLLETPSLLTRAWAEKLTEARWRCCSWHRSWPGGGTPAWKFPTR